MTDLKIITVRDLMIFLSHQDDEAEVVVSHGTRYLVITEIYAADDKFFEDDTGVVIVVEHG